ncbi:helix-turn-helix domain-containing protein [Amycolatopsis thermalba]|uniref:Helix-turn-helix domain-containing protein n=1 Tax=Amycolatopsis thermalba TaxID=944492 RepID=A0ABY4P1B6_9PSEU|nr:MULTISPECIES: helix-turn-helix transcriptional regulator [Amycolatopsis]UQS26073.1 helix-turn-helix domain-containing protein [Amycolatopsis thermalba]
MDTEPGEVTERQRALGEQLSAYRKLAGLTQAQLAKRLYCDRTTLAHVERGQRSRDEAFWRAADEALAAAGQLLAAYRTFENARAQAEHAARIAELEHHQRKIAQWGSGAGLQLVGVGPGTDVAAAGASAMTLGPALGAAADAARGPDLPVVTSTQVHEMVDHLREQWHLLVKTDNLFGPRYALTSVQSHLVMIGDLLAVTRDHARREVARVAAQYAESAAWLHEDAGGLDRAVYWTNRALEWAHEADDRVMLAWTLFRRSQQAAASGDAGQTIGLVQAAQRDEAALAGPMRAALAQQEAHGYALDGDAGSTLRKLDEALAWAATDTDGDARGGHGSFCTESYLELQRASCWLTLQQPKRAIEVFDRTLPTLPAVYRRDRGVALSRFAVAYAAVDEVEQAASVAREALGIARSAGSVRTEREIQVVGQRLHRHQRVAEVAHLLDDLAIAGMP